MSSTIPTSETICTKRCRLLGIGGRRNFYNLIATAPASVASILPVAVRARPLDTLPPVGSQPLALPASHSALTTQSVIITKELVPLDATCHDAL